VAKSIFKFLKPRAQAAFTNREKPLETFTTAIERVIAAAKPEQASCEILQFYGIGGVGKTRLLEQLKSLLAASYPDVVRAEVDFDDSSVREPHRALLRIRHTAAGNKRVNFKVFDFAYAVYFAKRNPDFSFEKRSIPLLEEAGVLGSIIAVFDGFGLVGAAKGIIEQTQKYSDKLSIKGEAREALGALKCMSERDIAEALPDFLAFDLNRHSDTSALTVLFVDTYEALWDNYTSEKDRFERDAWLRRLCSGLVNTLIVIAGREKLVWSDYDTKLARQVSTHRLSRLSEKDVRRFLLSAGVSSPTLIKKIITVADGHPYFLDLCLDMIAQEGETELDLWPESRRELFERFAKSLSSDELALLKRLAPLNTYDFEYARAAARHFNISLNDDEIHAHNRFSFVKQHEFGATIHDLMRRSLLSQIAEGSAKDIRQFALDHFSKRLSGVQFDASDAEIILPFQECVRQLKYLNAHDEVMSWLKSVGRHSITLLQRRAATAPILISLEALGDILSNENWPDDIQTAYADVTHLVGRYEESVAMLEQQIARAGPVADWTPLIAFANIRRMHHSMMYRPIEHVWNEVKQAINTLDLSNHTKAYGEAVFLLGGNLGCARGLPSDAWPWLITALGRSYHQPDKTLRVRVYRKVSDLYRIIGDLPRSRKILFKAVELANTINVPRYMNYLRCSQIDQLRLERRYDEALRMIPSTRERIAADNIDGWIGHTYVAESAVLLDAGRASEARFALDKALISYDRTNHLWGKLQVRMLLQRISAQSHSIGENHILDANNLIFRLRKAGYVRDALEYSEFTAGKTGHVPAIAFL
jgi:tetratricopeptide (TPR) repeat protein